MEKSIQRNLAYNFAYQILAVLLPLITTPYVSRVLGPEKVGEYSYAYAVAYYFVMIAMLGLNNYGNRTIASVRDQKEELSKEFCGIYLMQLLFGLLSLIAYGMYGLFFSNQPMTWIVSLYVISAIFDINWFFFGVESFKITVIRNAIIKLATTTLVFCFVKGQDDINKYALIMVSGALSSQLVLWKYIRGYVHLCKLTYTDVLKHIKPNLILFIPVVAVSLYKVMDKIMLGAMTTKTEVGLYESSERIIQIPMALIQSIGTVMLPKMTNLIANHDEKTSKNYISHSIMLVMLLSSSMSFGIMGVARYFVPIYYGEGYLKCVTLFQVLLPSCIFIAFANVIRTQFLIPKKRDKVYIISVVMGAIINLIVNYCLIPRFASVGAAVGTLIAEVVVCVYQALMVRKEIPIFEYVRKSVPFVVSGIIMYAVLAVVNIDASDVVNLFAHIIIGALIYVGLVWVWMIAIQKRRSSENPREVKM